MSKEANILIGIAITTIIVAFGVFFLSNPNIEQDASKTVGTDRLVRDDSPKIATGSAKVTIVEFGDYQCPACKMAFPIVHQVLNDYFGKVNFVFRHFPFPQHQNAVVAALSAEAAGEQGKYWEMHNILYENQEQWAENNNPKEIFVKYAQDLRLNVDQFKNTLNKGKFENKINRDKNDGFAIGVNSTPTFFINGRKLNNFSYNEFKKQIESSN